MVVINNIFIYFWNKETDGRAIALIINRAVTVNGGGGGGGVQNVKAISYLEVSAKLTALLAKLVEIRSMNVIKRNDTLDRRRRTRRDDTGDRSRDAKLQRADDETESSLAGNER